MTHFENLNNEKNKATFCILNVSKLENEEMANFSTDIVNKSLNMIYS